MNDITQYNYFQKMNFQAFLSFINVTQAHFSNIKFYFLIQCFQIINLSSIYLINLFINFF